MIIGVVSDTHGSIHPGLAETLKSAGVELILHAGDVGAHYVIAKLEQIAPVNAVRGNVDTTGATAGLPVEYRANLEDVDIYMTHIGGRPADWLHRLPRPAPGVAICGHSHIPLVEELGGVLFINPGSAGTLPRFGGGLSAALLRLEAGRAEAEIITFTEPHTI